MSPAHHKTGSTNAADWGANAAPVAPAERLALTPEWLWLQLMDWCKKRGSHPSEHNALFAIVSEARKLAAPAAPEQKDNSHYCCQHCTALACAPAGTCNCTRP